VTTVAADQLPDAETIRALLDRLAGELGLVIERRKNGRPALVGTGGRRVQAWREDYPYPERLRRKAYEPAKRLLQIELLKLQRTVKASGSRILILFEGRDAAGKGGTIRRFTENLNPRSVRVVALDKPAAHEQGDNYLARYLPHLPNPGEIVLFDRSWYNRAGVEQVMGFCEPDEYARFLRDVPEFERQMAADGITVIKLWFSITRAEQLSRFVDRLDDPVKRWKLSPIDLASLDKWDEYTRAKEAMFRHTDVPQARWTVIRSNDKKRARLEAMRYVLSLLDYEDREREAVGVPDPLITGPATPRPAAAGPGRGKRAAGRAPALIGRGPLAALDRSPSASGPVVASAGPGPADLVERDPGRDAGIERLGAGDRNPDDRVALLGDQPGQALAL
jgi:polyphosphate kinase